MDEADTDQSSVTSRRVKRVLDRLRLNKFMVVVWGPGASDPAHAKREDIRCEIQTQFPNADVHFSEDERLRCLTRDTVPYLHQEEFLHASAAHLIFALDMSQGVGEEIARFSSYPWIAKKLIVLKHERFKGVASFAADIRAPLAVEWFSDKDYDSCHLAKTKCPKHIMGWLISRL
jgi:hypothetical protein